MKPEEGNTGVEKNQSIIKYLLGEDTFDTNWYGFDVPGKPKFWWRTELSKETEAMKSENAALIIGQEQLVLYLSRSLDENAALIAALKELIPIAEKYRLLMLVTNADEFTKEEKSAIERAKLLTDGK